MLSAVIVFEGQEFHLKSQKEVFRNLALVFQFGINMIVPIILCTFLGIFLDRLLHTSFIVIVLFFLGAMAGFRNIYVFARNGSKRTSYIGSDARDKLDRANAGQDISKREDITQMIDRVYKENMNE